MRTILLFFAGAIFGTTGNAQSTEKKSVVIGKMATKENALLILNPPGADQGVLLPQLSTLQRTTLQPVSPSEDGLTVFDIELKSYFFWSNGVWVRALADNTTKTKFHSIDPLNFQELKTTSNIRHSNLAVFETDNTFVTATGQDGGEAIMASVNLPHGSVMNELTVYYMDNDLGRNLKVNLSRKSFLGSNQEILTWESAGIAPVVREQSFSSFSGQELIDLENYTYRLMVHFDVGNGNNVDQPSEARQRIYGVKIKYQE